MVKAWEAGELFQSTPPARGATHVDEVFKQLTDYFNPRPPRGGRPRRWRASSVIRPFQSTPPRGGRPEVTTHGREQGVCISIHAPREGGDDIAAPQGAATPPFQSTPPARGATRPWYRRTPFALDFNPRPPRGGRPVPDGRYRRRGAGYFNPRPPRGGRHHRGTVGRFHCYFNPRPPRGGRLRGTN